MSLMTYSGNDNRQVMLDRIIYGRNGRRRNISMASEQPEQYLKHKMQLVMNFDKPRSNGA